MDTAKKIPATIDEYIADFAPEKQRMMQQLRETIHAAAPEASEKISWAMPTFYLHGNLVHFAAFANHVSLFPGESGVAAFAAELGEYKHAKGTIQFPLTKPLPLELVRRIVQFRVKEQQALQAARLQKKAAKKAGAPKG